MFQRQDLMFSAEERSKLRNAVVLVAGVGGLGTNQALLLQRIGVKQIYLVDYDEVEESNLNRQVLFGVSDIGLAKVEQAKARLDAFGLPTKIVAMKEKIAEDIVIPPEVQLIYDALDHISSKLVLEKIARKNGLPLIHGGVRGFYGQVTTVIPGETASLTVLFGNLGSEEGEVPSFAPVVTVVASIQVVEGVNVLLGKQGLGSRLLSVDMSRYSLDLLKL